jgi:hypothetical protein
MNNSCRVKRWGKRERDFMDKIKGKPVEQKQKVDIKSIVNQIKKENKEIER